jgi:hypothetical protein
MSPKLVVSWVMKQLIIHDRSDGIHQHHSSLLWRGSTLTTPFWLMVLESYCSNDTRKMILELFYECHTTDHT